MENDFYKRYGIIPEKIVKYTEIRNFPYHEKKRIKLTEITITQSMSGCFG